jgi:hypothetical protein
MGRERNSSNAFVRCGKILDLGRNLFARVAGALDGAAPRLFRPMYAGANMGHPSREQNSLLASTTFRPSRALIDNYLTVLHHPSDVVNHHLDIAQRITLDRN